MQNSSAFFLPALLAIPVAADAFGIGRSTLRKWAHELRTPPRGFPQPVRVGGRVLYRRDDLIAWVDSLAPNGEVSPALNPIEDVSSPTRSKRGQRRRGAEG